MLTVSDSDIQATNFQPSLAVASTLTSGPASYSPAPLTVPPSAGSAVNAKVYISGCGSSSSANKAVRAVSLTIVKTYPASLLTVSDSDIQATNFQPSLAVASTLTSVPASYSPAPLTVPPSAGSAANVKAYVSTTFTMMESFHCVLLEP